MIGVVGTSKAQENYFVKTFTTENGLPHNHVRGIAQDQNGFLWIATWDGLSRWDGYEFKNYYNDPSDSTSLLYFQTDNVVVDGRNNVWVYTIHGLSRYNREKDKFTSYRIGLNTKIALDRNGILWYYAASGLYRWNFQTNNFELVPLHSTEDRQPFSTVYPTQIQFDNENNLWLRDQNLETCQFYRFLQDSNGGVIVSFIGNLEVKNLDSEYYYMAGPFISYSFPNQDFWIQANNLTYRYDKTTRHFLPHSALSQAKEQLALSTEELKKIKGNEEFTKPVIRDVRLHARINPSYIETFLIDRQNSLWQGVNTTGHSSTGLVWSIPINNRFKHYFIDKNPEAGLNGIYAVLKDKFGTVWAGPTNRNEFFRIDKKGNFDDVKQTDDTTWKGAGYPRSFLEDSTGIWIGYFKGLLLHYDFQTKKFTKVFCKKTGAQDRSIPGNVLHLVKVEDELYMTDFRGIFKMNLKTSRIETVKLFDHEIDFNLYCFIRDEGNGWWIGRNNSLLIRLDYRFNEIGRYSIGSGMFNIEDLIQGDNNDLWLSLLGGGLAHFDKKTGTSKIYTTKDGLSNNTCNGLLKDSHGNIWVATDHGISRFNPKTEKFRIFGPEDGLKIDEFTSDNTYLAPDGEMFFGGMGGVVSFYPDSLIETPEKKSAPSPLLIEDLEVSGVKRYFSKAIYECDTVILNKGDNNFQITFASLDFRNAEKIKYRYRLNNSDEFVQTDFRHRNLNYTNLAPGTYQLEIEATNRDGDWTSTKTLFIVIPPYFYQNLWFRLVLILLVVLILFQFIYGYNRRLRMNSQKKQAELRLESLRGQMNPHFIFNSLNSINYFISQNDRLSANRYIADFSRLIRSFLGNLSKEFITFESELETLKDYLQLEHLRFGDKFDYKLIVAEDFELENKKIFPGMVQPFIENAIWHGVRGLRDRKGNITIQFLPGSIGHSICIVEDDGIGRKLSLERKSMVPGKKSNGIAIVTERLKIINQIRNKDFKLIIEDLHPDQEETGTKVTIEIPLQINN
jgi:ligand-binding sensor domain-containing protein